jgi:NTE family protein
MPTGILCLRRFRWRKFWDGGILSNTPIRELFEAHKKFWQRKIGPQTLENSFKKIKGSKESGSPNDNGQVKMQKIPDLELYIVNLFDPRDSDIDTYFDTVSIDIDRINDRQLDINLSDGYDAKTDGLLSDYVNLIERLISLGDSDESLKEKINRILDEYTPRRFYTEEYKKNIDILKNTFKIVKVIQIYRKDDEDTISGKLADFTSETISKLIQQGYQDTLSK